MVTRLAQARFGQDGDQVDQVGQGQGQGQELDNYYHHHYLETWNIYIVFNTWEWGMLSNVDNCIFSFQTEQYEVTDINQL